MLADLLPTLGDNDVVMVMDADTALDQGFIAEAVRRFENDRALMAVGGIFYGEEGHGLLGQFQRNEYIRYSRQINRRRGPGLRAHGHVLPVPARGPEGRGGRREA